MSKLPKNGVVCPWFVGMGFYTSDTSFAPENVWPGTKWQKLEGRFILAASSGHAVGETGGEESHVLVPKELPDRVVFSIDNNTGKTVAVSGSTWGGGLSINSNNYVATCNHDAIVNGLNTNYTLDSQPHNNMPPYITRVYWERIE